MYATEQDIISIYGAAFLADVLPDDADDSSATVASALESASAEIDGYLSARYQLPLASQPVMLKRPAIDIATYILANRHSRLSETIENRYDQALELLAKISKGVVGLGKDEPKLDQSDGGASSSGSDFQARPRRFGRGNL